MAKMSSLLCATILLVASIVSAVTNTNTCIQLLPRLGAACQIQPGQPPSLGCCMALSLVNTAGCFCNPTLSLLLGANKTTLLQNAAMPACTLLSQNPLWANAIAVNKPFWGAMNCAPFQTKTYNSGKCQANDMQLDAARLGSTLGLAAVVQQFVQLPKGQCFNYPAYSGAISMFLDPAITWDIGYGIGSFAGLGAVIEYLSLTVSQVNKNLFRFTNIQSAEADKNVLYITPDGSKIILAGVGNKIKLFNKCSSMQFGYTEQINTYATCGTVISNILIPGQSVITGETTAVAALVGKVAAALETKTWGIQNVCHYHQQYCTGANKQFDSLQDCLDFMNALPDFSSACGNGQVMSGNSKICRIKHTFMIPLDPSVHCFHIGKGDKPDAQGHFKCNDHLECSPLLPTYSDPTQLSFALSKQDKLCVAKDVKDYNGWKAPNGICPSA